MVEFHHRARGGFNSAERSEVARQISQIPENRLASAELRLALNFWPSIRRIERLVGHTHSATPNSIGLPSASNIAS